MAFAPVAGTRLLAPFRISIANMLGNLVVQARPLRSTHAGLAARVGDHADRRSSHLSSVAGD